MAVSGTAFGSGSGSRRRHARRNRTRKSSLQPRLSDCSATSGGTERRATHSRRSVARRMRADRLRRAARFGRRRRGRWVAHGTAGAARGLRPAISGLRLAALVGLDPANAACAVRVFAPWRKLAQAPRVERSIRVRSGEHISSRAGADPDRTPATVAQARVPIQPVANHCNGQPCDGRSPTPLSAIRYPLSPWPAASPSTSSTS